MNTRALASACSVLFLVVAAHAQLPDPDTTPPTITACAPDVTITVDVLCEASAPDVTASVEASDDSGSFLVTQSPAAGTLFGPGVLVLTITVTDAAGNSTSCSASVTILDTTPPVIVACAADVSIVAGPGCSGALPDLTAFVVTTDACGSVAVTQDPPAGTTVGLGVHTLTLTVTDEHGNRATCSALVTVASGDNDGDGIADCADACPDGPSTSGVGLSEIYLNHDGVDRFEFLELAGPAGATLACYMLLVVDGDGRNAGTLDRAWDLGAWSIAASGTFVLGDSAVTARDIDLGEHDALENGTCTIYLVTTSQPAVVSGWVGTRIDLGDGTTRIPTVTTIVDAVALLDGDGIAGAGGLDRVFDGALAFGPDGTSLPAGIFRCGNAPHAWSSAYLEYDPSGSMHVRTPGAENPPSCPAGTAFCAGDGSGTPCPCGNESPAGAEEGCLSSLGTGGKLVASGEASLSDDTFVLHGSGMTNSFVLYFQGTAQLNGGSGAQFGDGLRCAGGAVIRLGVALNDEGASSHPGSGDPPVSVKGAIEAPTMQTYQAWYRNNDPGFCTSATFNLTNGWSVDWSL